MVANRGKVTMKQKKIGDVTVEIVEATLSLNRILRLLLMQPMDF